MSDLMKLKADARTAYDAVRDARQASIALLDSKGRRPANKKRAALYAAACDKEQKLFTAWEKADAAVMEAIK